MTTGIILADLVLPVHSRYVSLLPVIPCKNIVSLLEKIPSLFQIISLSTLTYSVLLTNQWSTVDAIFQPVETADIALKHWFAKYLSVRLLNRQ